MMQLAFEIDLYSSLESNVLKTGTMAQHSLLLLADVHLTRTVTKSQRPTDQEERKHEEDLTVSSWLMFLATSNTPLSCFYRGSVCMLQSKILNL